jgi:hypothetical protein
MKRIIIIIRCPMLITRLLKRTSRDERARSVLCA